MLPNRNCCCSRHTKTFAQKYLYAFPKAHTAWLPRQDFSLLHLRYVVINVFRELKLSCLFVRSWRLVEGVMRVLKLNWKCLGPVLLLGQRAVEALLSSASRQWTLHNLRGLPCWKSQEVSASVLTREKATLVASRGDKVEGHWGAGELIFLKSWSWQLELYELSCKLSPSSVVPLLSLLL